MNSWLLIWIDLDGVHRFADFTYLELAVGQAYALTVQDEAMAWSLVKVTKKPAPIGTDYVNEGVFAQSPNWDKMVYRRK